MLGLYLPITIENKGVLSMQLIKIIIKNYKYKSNLSSYIIYYTCLTISTAMFFITFTFLSSISMFSNMANAYDNVSGMFIIYTSFMIVVEVIFMNYAFNYYLARQKKNYGILIALGISNLNLNQFKMNQFHSHDNKQ